MMYMFNVDGIKLDKKISFIGTRKVKLKAVSAIGLLTIKYKERNCILTVKYRIFFFRYNKLFMAAIIHITLRIYVSPTANDLRH